MCFAVWWVLWSINPYKAHDSQANGRMKVSSVLNLSLIIPHLSKCLAGVSRVGFNVGVSILKIARKVFAFAIQYYSTTKDYEGVVPLRAIPTAVLSWGGIHSAVRVLQFSEISRCTLCRASAV